MPRPLLVIAFITSLYVAACSTLADVAGGGGDRSAAAIVVYINKDSLFVGDTLAIGANVDDANGKGAKTGDTVVVWQSSNTDVITIDVSNPPLPTPSGFARLIAKGAGQSTITAHTTRISTSKVVTVVGPANIGASDNRLGYALADQSSAPGPYSPVDSNRFNSGGGAITSTRDSTGWYNVRFVGLARQLGERDNVQATAYGSPAGVFCKLLSWGNDNGDMVVPVHCHRADGTSTDSRFTVLLLGARAFDLTTPLAFAQRLPQTQNLALDTSQTAFNSVTAHINFARSGIGSYNFDFPGIIQPGLPVTFQTTAVSLLAEHCLTFNYDITNGGILATCATAAGPADARPSLLWFTRGRAGHRYGFASTNNISAVTPPVDPTLTFNSSGGAVTSRRLSLGQWTVTFAGLGRPGGGKETVLVSALKDFDHICTLSSWATAGPDLTVTVQCFNPSGAPVDGRFNVLVVE